MNEHRGAIVSVFTFRLFIIVTTTLVSLVPVPAMEALPSLQPETLEGIWEGVSHNYAYVVLLRSRQGKGEIVLQGPTKEDAFVFEFSDIQKHGDHLSFKARQSADSATVLLTGNASPALGIAECRLTVHSETTNLTEVVSVLIKGDGRGVLRRLSRQSEYAHALLSAGRPSQYKGSQGKQDTSGQPD